MRVFYGGQGNLAKLPKQELFLQRQLLQNKRSLRRTMTALKGFAGVCSGAPVQRFQVLPPTSARLIHSGFLLPPGQVEY